MEADSPDDVENSGAAGSSGDGDKGITTEAAKKDDPGDDGDSADTLPLPGRADETDPDIVEMCTPTLPVASNLTEAYDGQDAQVQEDTLP